MQVTRRTALLLAAAALAAPPTIARAQVPAQAAQPGGFQLPLHLRPAAVRVRTGYAPGEIVVVTSSHYLYHVTEPGIATRYGVGVGREELNFRGRAVIGRKARWPSWRPTPEMIERNPRYAQYADGMPGGPGNPLGARALYLYRGGNDTAFRIHGTIEPSSIGRSVSNGCIRMLNEHVTALYDRVPVGTVVTVI
jgi:lipoprotein-anchoring transpeptidase ErfK/SrfK